METTKEEIRNYFFGNIFPFEDKIEFRIRGQKADLFDTMEMCVNHFTAPKKDTIERLREFINWALNQDDYGSLSGRAQFKRKAEQLLKETEPSEELDEQQQEDKLVEEKTDRNANIVASFMEHCQDNGLTIPDTFFESYFNA